MKDLHLLYYIVFNIACRVHLELTVMLVRMEKEEQRAMRASLVYPGPLVCLATLELRVEQEQKEVKEQLESR